MVVTKKFGGTSVGSEERIENVAERILADTLQGQMPVVIASAMSGETNRLITLAAKIDSQNRGPCYDMLVATGEQVSIALLSMALEKRGLKAKPLLAYQVGIETDNLYSKARILNIKTDKLKRMLDEGVIPVIAGFQGIDAAMNVTTLGRGGSDTTAVAIAAALGCRECEIYTDVPAVFTADPRLIEKAHEISSLSYEEMMEMASLGSKVLHIRSVELAAKYGVRIHVRSSFENRAGTWIVPEGEVMEKPLVSGVTHDATTVVIKLNPVPKGTGFLARIFSNLAARGVTIDIITQSEHEKGQQLAFSVSHEDLALTAKALEDLDLAGSLERITMDQVAKISIVGVGMRNHPGVAARFFDVLARENITVHLVTTSEIKISAVIEKNDLKKAASALHSEFGLDRM